MTPSSDGGHFPPLIRHYERGEKLGCLLKVVKEVCDADWRRRNREAVVVKVEPSPCFWYERCIRQKLSDTRWQRLLVLFKKKIKESIFLPQGATNG